MKTIKLQTQRADRSMLSAWKSFSWFSAMFDGIKISVQSKEPETLLTVIDDKDIFEMTPDNLIQAIRFFIAYSWDRESIVTYRNKYHHIEKDASGSKKSG